MTTIVARQYEWGCTIGADGQSVLLPNEPFSDPRLSKIQARGSYLIGSSGPGFLCETITRHWVPPRVQTSRGMYDFVASVVAPQLRTFLGAVGYPMDGSDGNRADTIIAVRGEAFYITDDATVLVRDVLAIGTGAPYALGAMASSPKVGCPEALRIAAQFDVFTGPPFKMFDQFRKGYVRKR